MQLYTPLSKEVLKDLVGKEIVLYPLGNNRDRRIKTEEEQLKTKTVTKVTSKNIECGDYCKFNIHGEHDRHNRGYYAFLTMEDALEYLDLQNFASKTFTHNVYLSLEQAREIKKIICC